MLILWIRKRKTGDGTSQAENDKDSFLKHDEAIKKFFFSHPRIEAANPRDIKTEDGHTLVPVYNVKLTRHIQN